MTTRILWATASVFGLSIVLTACGPQAGGDKAGVSGAASKPTSDGAAPAAHLTRGDVPESGTIGLAFSYFWYDNYETERDCPEGLSYALRDIAIMDLPQARQDYLLQPENRSTYYKMGYALAGKRAAEQGGISTCNIPYAYDDPPLRIVQSGMAHGRDLDGKVSDEGDVASCGNADAVSPDGRAGIDNNLWKVMGCIDSYRRTAEFAGGAFEDYHIGAYRDGEITTLMEITGVDDLQNDDRVEVGVYSSHEPTPYDGENEGLGYASLTVTDNTLWHNHTTGRIENGVLITEPFELRLKFGWTGRPAEYLIKQAQFHLTLDEDGGAAGDMVGYADLKHTYWQNFHDERGALQVANGYTCPSAWRALETYADGIKDPETGKCTGISTAMKVEAVPAFVIHPPEEALTKYVMDTREYYGVTEEDIAVAGAELRPLVAETGPDSRVEDEAETPAVEEAQQ